MFGLLCIAIVLIIVFATSTPKNTQPNNNSIAITQNPNRTTPTPHQTPAPVPKNPMSSLNVILFVGCAFIVIALESLASAADASLIPPLSCALTAILLGAGLTLYKKVKYMQPVGKALTISALIATPFLGFCFSYYGLSTEVCLALASGLTLLASSIVCLLLEDKIMPLFAYIWLYIFPVSLLCAFFDTKAGTYGAIITGTLLAIPPAYCWFKRVSWLPVRFRLAAQSYTYALPILLCMQALLFIASNEFSLNMSFYRSIAMLCGTALSLIYWTLNRRNTTIQIARIFTQFSVIATVMDITSFSFFNSKLSQNTILVAVVWFTSFVIQAIISLFHKSESENESTFENITSAFCMLSILATPTIAQVLALQEQSLLMIASLITVAGLSIAFCIFRKNILWAIATVTAISLIPSQIANLVEATSDSVNIAMNITSAIVSLVCCALYIPMSKLDKQKSFTISVISAIFNSFISLCYASQIYSNSSICMSIPFFCLAAGFTILGLQSKSRPTIESSIYLYAVSILFFTYGYTDALTSEMHSQNLLTTNASHGTHLLYRAIRWFGWMSAAASLLVNSILNELKPRTNRRARLVFAYILASLAAFIFSVDASYDDEKILFTVLYIILQAITLALGAIKDKTWAVISSICQLIIGLMLVSGDMPYVWIGGTGISLVGIVIWQVIKRSKQLGITETKDINKPKA